MPSADSEPPAHSLEIRAAAITQVFVDDIYQPVLDPDDLHHLTKVLRIRAGESIAVCNGAGSWRMCEWRDGLEPVTDISVEETRSSVEVGFALTKGDKPEWTVQKLTEVGVSRIVPFVSDRTIVKWDRAKSEKHVQRFRRIAREASMQCRRLWLPEVTDLTTFDNLSESGFAIAAPGELRSPQGVNKIAIGPEGGWSERELASSSQRVTLGDSILRAETAALVAAVLMQRGN